MDAFELTHPVLSSRAAVSAAVAPSRPQPMRSPRPGTAPLPAVEQALLAARRFTYQLPLGSAPQPLAGRQRWSYERAAREVEGALWRVAVGRSVPVDVEEPPTALARRLARSRVIVPPAADAVAALLPVLEAGAAGRLDDASVEPSAAKLAERVVGYLVSRA